MQSVLISACLLGCNCKYSGGNNQISVDFPASLRLIPLCPEQMGGLPTPRPPAECRDGRVITKDGEDVTAQYEAGAEEALRLAKRFGCTHAILKARSPSCGYGEIYDGSFSGRRISGMGVTARRLSQGGITIYSEETPDFLEKITNSSLDEGGKSC